MREVQICIHIAKFRYFLFVSADEKVDDSMGNLLTNLTKYFYVAFCFCFFQTIYENL